MQETKNFKGKNIIVRDFLKSDLNRASDFLNFINSLVEEEAKILVNNKVTLKQEEDWLKNKIKSIKDKNEVFLVAEDRESGMIVGTTSIRLHIGVESHVGEFGIAIRSGYRRIGLGKYLMKKILQKAKKEFKEKPRIIRISVYSNNKPATALYEKLGFKIVAEIPKQVKYRNRYFSEIILLKDLN